MSIFEILILAVGLSMDAFAVSVTNGMTKKNVNIKWTFAIAACFGIFQGLMPAIGYFLGSTFTQYVTRFDHYIALVLLGFIGGKMLLDGLKKDDSCEFDGTGLTVGALLLQGVATSIDALAIGITFAFLRVDIYYSIATIGLTTFIFSAVGVIIGNKFGSKYKNKAEIAGGVILILIGLKILLEHLGILNF